MNSIISLSELDLPFPVSPVMSYEETPVAHVGEKLVIGYLSPDDDCENPLASCCGMGKVFSAHRNDGRESHEGMQDALALDREWNPQLDLCDDYVPEFRRLWIEAAADSQEFQAWADRVAGPEAQLDAENYQAMARKYWRKVGVEPQGIGVEDIWSFSFTDDVRNTLWRTLRGDGKIGDPDVVMLDCYEHGGRAWSLSGQGMQCQFDTASGAGVWVPDDEARSEIQRRSKVYAFGQVHDNGSWTPGSGRKRYWAQLDVEFGNCRSEDFLQWHEAYQWLENSAKKLKKRATKPLITRGRKRAAREIAACVIDVYNDWLSGDCHGIVVCVYQNTVDDPNDEPEWELVESEECWGYVGSDAAMAELRSSVSCEVRRLSQLPMNPAMSEIHQLHQ